ncbi:VOC family protein [Arachidicoccus terrestris]|uniref:VOC family protein n=1 Tax=Arachidicoccus terrestris TaxID=2875539 RepID=UPI001CC71F1E|nr:VOC family protein [Arachidicoccus terrestris]UAY54879.1 VOC family protein [Arachidicoccus terrestris]
MRINHLNLVVNDVQKTTVFFETYFDFQCKVVKGDNIIAVLQNPDKFSLVIMQSKTGDTDYPKDFHIGFMLDSPDEVDDLHRKLLSGKNKIDQFPKNIRNSYGFYFYFDNLFIEIGHHFAEAK